MRLSGSAGVGRPWVGLSALGVVLLAACPAPGDGGADGGVCSAGRQLHEASGMCIPAFAPSECGPGTTARVGEPGCVPVGWTDCGEGFEPHPSGWGCLAILPTVPCAGATRAALGSRECAPVGDCAAPFPPAEASLFVDAGYTDAELDATHFRTVFDAVAAAPQGGVIAIESGTYVESLEAVKSYRLVGRCAAEVLIESPNTPLSTRGPGVRVGSTREVVLEGLTLRGHLTGVVATDAGRLTLRGVVIEDAISIGVGLNDAATTLTAEDVLIRGVPVHPSAGGGFGLVVGYGSSAVLDGVTIERADVIGVGAVGEGTRIEAHDLVVRDLNNPDGTGSLGFSLEVGSVLVVDGLAVEAVAGTGLVVSEGADAALARAHFRGSGPAAAWAVTAQTGARVAADGLMLDGLMGFAASAQGAGSRLELRSAVAHGILAEPVSLVGAAFHASEGGELALSDFVVDGVEGFGIVVEVDGSAAIERGLVRNGVAAGSPNIAGGGLFIQQGSEAVVREVTVEGGGPVGLVVSGVSPSDGRITRVVAEALLTRRIRREGGFEVAAGIAVQDRAALEVERSVVVDVTDSGIIAKGLESRPDLYASLQVRESAVLDTRAEGEPAIGVGGAGGYRVERSLVWGNEGVGVSATHPSGETVLVDCVVGGSVPDPIYQVGHGLTSLLEGTIRAVRTRISANASVGVVGALGGGIALQACEVTDNRVGVHAQDGSTLRLVETLPDPLVPGEVAVDEATVFEGNETRVGTGSVPLPDPGALGG